MKHGAKVGVFVSWSVVMVTHVQPSEDAIENNCPLHVSCYNGHTDVVVLLVNDPHVKINQQVCLYHLITLLAHMIH